MIQTDFCGRPPSTQGRGEPFGAARRTTRSRGQRMARKLTNQQVAVLAAVERLGHPMLVDLRRDLSALGMSTIHRQIEALKRRGLVVEHGTPPRYAAQAPDSGGVDLLRSLPAWD